MAGTFKFELVSPERVLLSENAEQVVLSGTEGDFTVLAGHAPVIATLLPSVIHATLPDPHGKKAIYIKGGFAEVTPDTLSVLVQHAFITDEADPRQIDDELAAVEAAMDAEQDDEARIHLSRALDNLKALQAEKRGG
ncbi:MAG: ATP synthase F1 subunit epsilon [Pseudomonadota bacterium]